MLSKCIVNYIKQTLLYYRDTSYFYCLFDFYFITITFLFLYKNVTGHRIAVVHKILVLVAAVRACLTQLKTYENGS